MTSTTLPLADLPKVALHDHLDGGLRPSTIIEIAAEIGLELPTTDPDALAQWFVDSCSAGTLAEYLRTFDITTAVMQTREHLVRIAREFALDLAADGVVYGEVRWAPEQHLTQGLSLDEAVEAVQQGLDEAVAEVAERGGELRVGQLVSAMRQADRGLEIAELAIRHRDRGVVGFDIAGPELGFPASRLKPAFDLLAEAMLPVTVHAGEADGIDSVRDALLAGRALRLGHGVATALDISHEGEDSDAEYVALGPVAQWVRDRGIALEICPSSNLQTEPAKVFGPTLGDQPFDLLYQLGFRVTVNTDNRLMSGTSITRELEALVDTFGYDLDDLELFQLNAVEASFLPLDERERLAQMISEGFDAQR